MCAKNAVKFDFFSSFLLYGIDRGIKIDVQPSFQTNKIHIFFTVKFVRYLSGLYVVFIGFHKIFKKFLCQKKLTRICMNIFDKRVGFKLGFSSFVIKLCKNIF